MAVKYVYEFTVEGKNPFPLDMLRYDSCWPRTSEDASMIGAAIRRDRLGLSDPRSVTLITETHEPTDGRWRSFGWKVTASSKHRQTS